MGHFGILPIRLTWFALVLPSLLLNYFGQGALMIANPETVANPFFLMIPGPEWMIYPVVALATAATVIASQAVISGAFSLTRQAVQLGYFPRMEIRQTSSREIGQIYIPVLNWILLVACVGLVIGFQLVERARGGLRRRRDDGHGVHDAFSSPSWPGASGGGRSRPWSRCAGSSSSSTSRSGAPTCPRSPAAAGSRSSSPLWCSRS